MIIFLFSAFLVIAILIMCVRGDRQKLRHMKFDKRYYCKKCNTVKSESDVAKRTKEGYGCCGRYIYTQRICWECGSTEVVTRDERIDEIISQYPGQN